MENRHLDRIEKRERESEREKKTFYGKLNL